MPDVNLQRKGVGARDGAKANTYIIRGFFQVGKGKK